MGKPFKVTGGDGSEKTTILAKVTAEPSIVAEDPIEPAPQLEIATRQLPPLPVDARAGQKPFKLK